MKMSTIYPVVLMILSIALLTACGGGKHEEHEDEGKTWTALDDFHMIMADAYHPLKDSSNLAPAKAIAEKLAAEAEKWAAAPLPERVNNDEMTARLENLKNNTRAFADKVKAGAPDEELSAALTSLHDEFHHIMEAWEGGHNEHH